jgi:hypothetical protein
MPGIGYTFQDTDMNSSSGSRTWIVIAAVVTLATVGVILLVRAFGDDGEEKPAKAAQAQSATEGMGNGKREMVQPPGRPTAQAQNRKTDKPTNGQTDKRTNRQTVKPDMGEASATALAFMRAGEAAEKADDFFAARTNYLAALADPGCGNARPVAEARLGVVDIALIFSPREMDGKIDYAIASGDSLKKIANRHGTTVDLIVKGNAVPNPDRVQVGDRLRILDNQVFEIAVSKARNDLVVTLNGQFFKRYTVGTGKFAKTPVGTFQISDKIPDPPWWRPDGKVVPFGNKENILGTRWMAIVATGDTPPAKGYGIHGTWDEASLGQQSSAGCIRMANRDVEELFTYVPLGTKVVIGE